MVKLLICVQYRQSSLTGSGTCAISPSSERCYLAYPLPQKSAPSVMTPPSHVPPTAPHLAVTSGSVVIFDAITMQPVNVVEAHRAPLSCVALNSEGTRLATASDKGTIIRVFSVPEGKKLFQFRRGSMPARILSMSFNVASTLLCVSSATETVHIFRLSSEPQYPGPITQAERRPRRPSERSLSPGSEDLDDDTDISKNLASDIVPSKSDGTFAGMLRRTSQNVSKNFAATLGGYLPSAVSEMLEPTRDFAWIKLPKPVGGISTSVRSVVALSSSSPQVLVATGEGSFFVFSIDLEKGGEGVLTNQYS